MKEPSERKALAKHLSKALYDVERKLRPPEDMAKQFLTVLQSVSNSSVRNISEWTNSIQSNLQQIRSRDQYVSDCEYLERGEKIRVVSTSQLEAIHSKLRKLLDRVGLGCVS